MSPRGRLFLGAAVGALLVLFAHPNTRPALFAPFRQPSGGLTKLLARPPLGKPNNLVSGAAYLHAGAERLLNGPELRTDERRTLVSIAAEGTKAEPENAFWPLARSIFTSASDVRRQWTLASHCRIYDDHQNAFLEEDRRRLVRAIGDDQAWTYAAVAPRRSEALARCIVSEAKSALAVLQPQVPRDRLACETIRNGAMLRDGGRSLKVGEYGIAMIEAASYPPELAADVSPHRLWSAKTALTGRLRAHGLEAEARFCDSQYRTNDSWQAFGSVQDPMLRFQTLRLAAVVVDALPGGLLASIGFGALMLLVGRGFSKVAETNDRFAGPEVVGYALSLLVGGLLLGYPLGGFAAAACAFVLVIGPEHPRPFDGHPLGPLHAFAVGCASLGLLGFTGLAAISLSLAGRSLAGADDLGAWLADTPRLGVFVVLLVGASTLVPPGWAVVRRYSTPALAAFTYRGFGRLTILLGLVLAIVLSPLSLAADRWLGIDLRHIQQNEQVYYNPSDPEEP